MRRRIEHPDISIRFPKGPNPFARTILIASYLLVAGLFLQNPSLLVAAHVVVVKTSDAEPYSLADTSIRERLVASHHEVRTVGLKEIADKDLAVALGHPDIVIAVGTPSARLIQKQLPPSIRMVYCMVTSAGEAGLLSGRESWGVTTEIAVAEQFKVIAETLPRARSMGMLYRSDTPDGTHVMESIRASLPAGWQLEAVAVNDHPSVAAAIDALTQKHLDLIWTSTDQKVYDNSAVRALLLAGLRTKTPVWGFSPAFVRAGALAGVGVDPRSQGTQAAGLAVKAMAGECTAANKAEAPQEFQIAVNLIVARQIGVEIPESLLKRATFVYRPEN